MKFGTISIGEAEGAILAHSLQTRAGVIKKGRPLDRHDVDRLRAAGYETIIAARLEPEDVGEDAAAAAIARAACGSGVRVSEPFTGRSNLFATQAGIVRLDVDRLMALNRIDEAVTIATVPSFERVAAGQMLATVKVIPFAVSERIVERAVGLARGGLVSLAPFEPHQAGLILTRLSNTKPSLLQKRERVMADRLAAMGSTLAATLTVPHETDAVKRAIETLKAQGRDPILVFAASAIVDRSDVIPAAVVAAGGNVLHLGMPVDPGNLLMTGRLDDTDVIGVPSCAGSPKLNGFDWVLERRLAGLDVSAAEISAMGVGGLLKEIATRPQPRVAETADENEAADDHARREPRIGCIVLAAGRSSRMGANNKLLEQLDGLPIVRRTVEAVLASRATPVIVVTGHQAAAVGASIDGLDVKLVHNPDFAQGMSTSLKAGIQALPPHLDGAVVALADMPEIEPAHIDRMISAFAPKEGRTIVVPVFDGSRGNPVLWSAEHFPAMCTLAGDMGARHIIQDNADGVVELDLGSEAVLTDVDTPEALAELRASRSAAKSEVAG